MLTPILQVSTETQIMMFHTSSVARQLPNHPLYPKLDWSKVGGGHYAIVDPMDDNGILYLSEKEYKIQVRVSVSQDSILSVLARPNDVRVEPSSDPSQDTSQKPKTPPSVKEELGLVPFRKGGPLARRDSVSGHLFWYISRLSSLKGRQLLVETTGENLLPLLLHWGLDLNVRAGGQLEPQPALNEALVQLGRSFTKILLTRGRAALIMKMKNTLFFVNNWLAGFHETNPFLLGEPVGLSRGGLPRILPVYLRRALGSKNRRLIMVVESLLSAYKALEGPHQDADLVNITTPCPPIKVETLEDFQYFCRYVFWPKVVYHYAAQAGKEYLLRPRFRPRDSSIPFFPLRGGPNHQVAILGAPLDAVAWAACPRNHPMAWFRHVGDRRSISLFEEVLSKANMARDALRERDVRIRQGLPCKTGLLAKRWDFNSELDVGRLAFLPEAAGKVRTIAIVDYWTQRAMKPVHDWMMEVLSVLPTDATFDQEEALRSYVRETGVSQHHSIDLKSATDMIPIELYESVLLGILPKQTVVLWMALLTDRLFRIPSDGREESPLVIPTLRGTLIEYSRGQPMGTLSSWASMSLVHHALELYSAWKEGLDPVTFTSYRVLGDDNVTGNDVVAARYKSVCEDLQVPISLQKTLVGKLFTFAGQVYLDGKNISPMSLKEELSVKTASQRIEMALRAVTRGWCGDKLTTMRFLRLLCRTRDYLRTTIESLDGKLGRVAQTALISAFGVGSRTLSRIGFQESSLMPFLLSIENKVSVLGGDEACLSPRNRKLFSEIETLFAIGIMRTMMKMKNNELELMRAARRRWDEWFYTMTREGPGILYSTSEQYVHPPNCLPISKVARKKFPVPLWPMEGAWILPDGGAVKEDRVGWTSFSTAVWPILKEYYVLLFRVEPAHAAPVPPEIGNEDGHSPDETATVASNGESASPSLESLQEEFLEGVLNKDEILAALASSPELCDHPDPIGMMTNARKKASRLLYALKKGDKEGNPVKGALEQVYEVIELYSKIPTIPGFESLDSLLPDRSPKAANARSAWVRQMSTFGTLCMHVDFSRDFSLVDYPVTRVGDAGRAIDQTDRRLSLPLLRGKRCLRRVSKK